MNILLNKYIKENGNNSINDIKKLSDYLLSNNQDSTYVYRLSLILDSGNFKRFIDTNTKQLNSVNLNNIITNITENSGLKQKFVTEILYDVLTSLNISCDYNMLFGFDTEKENKIPIVNIIPKEEIKSKLEYADSLLNDNNFYEAVKIYSYLSKCGSDEAMYKLAMLKKYELSNEFNKFYQKVLLQTEVNKEKKIIIDLLETSSANGNIYAKAELGNLSYDDFDFYTALNYYTSPGVISASSNTKEKVINIINQRRSNAIFAILNGVSIVFMWLFLIFNTTTIDNNDFVLIWGIIITTLSTCIFSLICIFTKLFRYSEYKILSLIMLLIWSIYPLIIALN